MSSKSSFFSVSLPDNLKEKAEERITTGDFAGASDYIRWLIRNDLEKQQKLANMRALVQEGVDELERGEYTELNQELIDRIKAQGRAEIASETR